MYGNIPMWICGLVIHDRSRDDVWTAHCRGRWKRCERRVTADRSGTWWPSIKNWDLTIATLCTEEGLQKAQCPLSTGNTALLKDVHLYSVLLIYLTMQCLFFYVVGLMDKITQITDISLWPTTLAMHTLIQALRLVWQLCPLILKWTWSRISGVGPWHTVLAHWVGHTRPRPLHQQQTQWTAPWICHLSITGWLVESK